MNVNILEPYGQKTTRMPQIRFVYAVSNGHIPDMYIPKEWTSSYLNIKS